VTLVSYDFKISAILLVPFADGAERTLHEPCATVKTLSRDRVQVRYRELRNQQSEQTTNTCNDRSSR